MKIFELGRSLGFLLKGWHGKQYASSLNGEYYNHEANKLNQVY